MSDSPITRGANTLAEPVPLSPDDFGNGDGGPNANPIPNMGQAAGGSDLTDSDIETLRQVRILIKEARAAIANSDDKTVIVATRQLKVVVGYLLGFLDSRGLINPQPIEPGFEISVGEAARPDVNEGLDEIEQGLDDLLTLATDSTRGTRGWKTTVGNVLTSVGDACIAVGTTLIGIGVGVPVPPV